MRLTKLERQIIKRVITAYDAEVKIILFGSRTNDNARGGDIDLLIISQKITRKTLSNIRWSLWEKLGEQKIDLILSNPKLSDTFAQIAFEQGIAL